MSPVPGYEKDAEEFFELCRDENVCMVKAAEVFKRIEKDKAREQLDAQKFNVLNKNLSTALGYIKKIDSQI